MPAPSKKKAVTTSVTPDHIGPGTGLDLGVKLSKREKQWPRRLRRNICNKDKDVAPGVKKSSCSRRESLEFRGLPVHREPHAKGLCDVDLPRVAEQSEGGKQSARVPGPKNEFRIGLIAQRGKRHLSKFR